MTMKNPVVRSASPARGGIVFAAMVLVVGALVYWIGPGIGAPDYPDDWPAPRLFAGSKGGCPDLGGTYDGVDDELPRILQGQPAWVQGGHPWFEHRVAVTQADDGSTLTLDFALNERGLPEHREHVMTYNQGWPSGGTLVLKRDAHFECSGRWLTTTSGEVKVSKDRAGNLIVAEHREVSGQFTYGNLRIGPETVDKTLWRQFPRRPAEAEARLRAVYSFEVNRYPWYNRDGHEVVVKLGNYEGEDICVRIWEPGAAHPDDASANAPVLTGTIYDRPGCPPAWLRMRHLGNDNFGLRIPDVTYRIAWRLQADPAAVVHTIEVPNPAELALMPDQDEAQRKRAIARMTPEQRAQAKVRAQEREQQRAREQAEQQRLERERAEAAVHHFASEPAIAARIQKLAGEGIVIDQVQIEAGRVRIAGKAPSNALVSQLLRAIDGADAQAGVDLLSLRSANGNIEWAIALKPGALTDQ